MDYFNDRYDGDSDWQGRTRLHDPSEPELKRRLDAVLNSLEGLDRSVSDIAIGISPGFFPAEFWAPYVERIDARLIEQNHSTNGDELSTRNRLGSVELRAGHGRNVVPYEQFWHVYSGGYRAGRVVIKDANHPTLGVHRSIDVHINAAARGQGIGTIVFRFAAELSGADQVYAHARRSNIASRSAARRAGYRDIIRPKSAQSTMLWERESSH